MGESGHALAAHRITPLARDALPHDDAFKLQQKIDHFAAFSRWQILSSPFFFSLAQGSSLKRYFWFASSRTVRFSPEKRTDRREGSADTSYIGDDLTRFNGFP